MPRVYIHSNGSGRVGGGWSWVRNIGKYFESAGVLSDLESAEWVIVPSASMISREDFYSFKGKKILLRI